MSRFRSLECWGMPDLPWNRKAGSEDELRPQFLWLLHLSLLQDKGPFMNYVQCSKYLDFFNPLSITVQNPPILPDIICEWPQPGVSSMSQSALIVARGWHRSHQSSPRLKRTIQTVRESLSRSSSSTGTRVTWGNCATCRSSSVWPSFGMIVMTRMRKLVCRILGCSPPSFSLNDMMIWYQKQKKTLRTLISTISRCPL